MSSESSFKIPPEIITDILHRLPAKPLGRFRCVSTDWLSLISHPQFIKTHQTTHNQTHLIFLSNDDSLYSIPIKTVLRHHEPEEQSTPTKLRFKSNHIDFTLYCNGLVLVSVSDFNDVHKLVVLNPTTGGFVELKNSDCEVINNLFEIEIVYGFAYDSFSDDYKVVTISYFHNNYLIPPDRMYVHIYSLGSNNWRRVNDSDYDYSHGRGFSGVFVNGFLHWVGKKNSSDHSWVIVAFGLADEKFSEIQSPDSFNDFDVNDWKLVLLGGKLCVFKNGVIWVMNEYGVKESWSKIVIHGLHESSKVEPVFFDENGKILLVGSNLVLIYDVEERRLYKNVTISRCLKNFRVKGTYVESLMSPKFGAK